MGRSSIGPQLFILYTAELIDIAEDLGINIHMYADDTQLYVYCSPRDAIGTVSKLELCLDRVDRWMIASRLKLNSEKSEVIWVGPKCTVMQHSSNKDWHQLFRRLRQRASPWRFDFCRFIV